MQHLQDTLAAYIHDDEDEDDDYDDDEDGHSNTNSSDDVVFFDGGSNFQLAGRIIMARFPRITVVHGLEHVLSLVFVDISKIPVIHVSYFVL